MRSKRKGNCEVVYPFGHRITIHKKMASELLEEYEQRLRAGENPSPSEYLARYPGPDKDTFRIELNLVTLLLVDAKKRAQEWDTLVASGQISKVEKRLSQKLACSQKIDRCYHRDIKR